MKLTVVGCSGSIPGPESAASCYLLEHNGFHLVVDLGHGAVGPLQQYIGLGDLDAVAITHLHADHWVDLLALDVARAYGPYGVFGALPVYGPSELEKRLAMAGGSDQAPVKRTTFEFNDLSLATEIGPFRIRTARMSHPGEAHAIRFDVGGASLVFSGDTGPCENIALLAEGADLLLLEASAMTGDDNPPDLHLTGTQAGEVGEASGISHLVLTHVPPWNSVDEVLAEARTTYPGEITMASPGLVLEVGR